MARSSANSASSLRCRCCEGWLGFSACAAVSCGHSQLELCTRLCRQVLEAKEAGGASVLGPCSGRISWTDETPTAARSFDTGSLLLVPVVMPSSGIGAALLASGG